MSRFAGLWTLKGGSSFAVDPPNVAISTVSQGTTSFLASAATATAAAPPTAAQQITVFIERSVCATGNCVPVPIS